MYVSILKLILAYIYSEGKRFQKFRLCNSMHIEEINIAVETHGIPTTDVLLLS